MDMECGCVCDFDCFPAVYRQSKPVARKPYKCCECGGPILAGQKYDYVFAIWNDGAETFRTCLVCARIRDDYCCSHGNLRQNLWDSLGVDYITGAVDDDLNP